jgi:hypothetical protein
MCQGWQMAKTRRKVDGMAWEAKKKVSYHQGAFELFSGLEAWSIFHSGTQRKGSSPSPVPLPFGLFPHAYEKKKQIQLPLV